jgi:ribosomal protein L37E
MSAPEDFRKAGGARRLAPFPFAATLLPRLVLAVAFPTLAHGTAAAAAAQARAVERPVEIRLNGERLGRGLMLVEQGREEVWLRVADLWHAIDGSDAGKRLRRSGRELYAAELGGCAACRFGVVRQVVVSRRVRDRAGEPYVPLEDVARAFEAKVSQVAGASVIHLHVGECRWCILEPRPVEAASRAEGAL